MDNLTINELQIGQDHQGSLKDNNLKLTVEAVYKYVASEKDNTEL